jgi:hypothetical protein
MNGGKVELIIDELVVHGTAGLDRGRFAAGVERELAHLIREAGGLSDIAEPTGLRLGAPAQTIHSAPGRAPEAAQMARAIHGALKR